VNQVLQGRCLCGAVKFSAEPPALEMGVCHCGMCRRWSGGAAMFVRCGDTVTVNGEDNLGVYVTSDWGERCFCKMCGTHLLWRARKAPAVSVMAQAFDTPEIFDFVREIYIDEKPANYSFAGVRRTVRTAAEHQAKYAALLDRKG
jgi:hypothetical protein